MDDSTVVKKIESFPNNFYKACLESGEILHIQCDTTIDNYIFQKIKIILNYFIKSVTWMILRLLSDQRIEHFVNCIDILKIEILIYQEILFW